jgi:hypothetical protein
MPRAMSDAGYATTSIGEPASQPHLSLCVRASPEPIVFSYRIRCTQRLAGKDHFGWNVTSNTGISHGYQSTFVYDGLGDGMPV